MRKIVSLATILVLSATGQQAAAQLAGRCQGLDPAQDGDADRAFECIAALENKLDEVMALYARAEHSHRPDIPAGAVLAFDSSSGCPDGWAPFAEAQGRAIIGATTGRGLAPGMNTNEDGAPLAEYKYREHGGTEIVTLSDAQMPEHRHDTIDTLVANRGFGTNAFTLFGDEVFVRDGEQSRMTFIQIEDVKDTHPPINLTGRSQPHNNMPPYIALYFCKKD